MAIGPTLREARQQKQLTTSQVAEITRMKVQIVDDLENDDFHRIAATIYGKGFIKLFAECVELDPEPLITDYLHQVGSPQPPKLPPPNTSEPRQDVGPQDTAETELEPQNPPADDLFSYADHNQRRARRAVSAAPHPPPAAELTSTAQQPRRRPLVKVVAQHWQKSRQATAKCREDIIRKITESGAHDRWIQRILLALGVIVLILILIPLLRMIFTPRPPPSLPDDTLILFMDPPEPYLE